MSPLMSGLTSIASMVFNAASAGRGSSISARHGGDASAGPSAVVSLSREAQALASAAGRGTPASVVAATSAPGAGKAGGPAVSKADFQAMLERFGADDAQKQAITAGFDQNQDGAITQHEFMHGLARLRDGSGDDAFSQSVRQLMDQAGNGDGTVAAKEFLAWAGAFAALQQKAKATV